MKPRGSKTSEKSENWSGTMTCTVINLTSQHVEKVSVTHTLGKYTDIGSNKSTMDIGESFDFPIHVGSYNMDLWLLEVKFLTGVEFNPTEREGELYEVDFTSGLPIYFIVGPRNAGYSIQAPRGDSYMGNSYG